MNPDKSPDNPPEEQTTAGETADLNRREFARRLARAAIVPAVLGVMAASSKTAHASA